jgi:hypothetical protein
VLSLVANSKRSISSTERGYLSDCTANLSWHRGCIRLPLEVTPFFPYLTRMGVVTNGTEDDTSGARIWRRLSN